MMFVRRIRLVRTFYTDYVIALDGMHSSGVLSLIDFW